ncbi:GNAT family N-acetyltransferase [Flavobacterium rakeshii]|uniref:GNAT family N-acetyltransferase n=1 Tax=Flavobacterium rakeshii TaxID=1038845 RepID=A0A6N8HH44_9FLAO|nr:GNAT family N-acetyltransferase [Flavobacterium rakeshii]MUV04976.1 GNAT family N-acetyltransferase [Flavobacterium rakeshii]
MVSIREYTSADKPYLIALLRLNTPHYFSHEEEQDLIDYLDNSIYKYYVLTKDDNIVGAGGINLSADLTTGILSWDFFHPDYHGQGLGTTLTLFRIQKIKEISTATTMRVRTSQLTYKFYGKFGFKIREISKDYWAKGLDLYRMENNISNII